MPTLKLHLSHAQDAPRHSRLAQALTDITARTLGKRADLTAVLIDERPDGHWHVGGRPLQQPSFLLEIDITAGTNTEAQKADFQRVAFAELARQLAPGAALEPASYVVVRELPAGDWGFGGLSQLHRRRAAPPPDAVPADVDLPAATA